jgi:hypothetical protein
MFAIANKPQQLNTSTAEIVVIPAHERYVEQMGALQRAAYEDDDVMTADHFRSHLHYFPEGQFIAIDTATDQVVGLTSGMRVDFNRAEKLLESWHVTTGGG